MNEFSYCDPTQASHVSRSHGEQLNQTCLIALIAEESALRRVSTLISSSMLNSVSVCGVPGIQKVFLQQHDKPKKESVLETDGINVH
ncbi:hypothetical protein BDR07DRAFT_1465488 [Suillus spraguei]|nr:hypothetical protein BDR07DRAFT_1467135 [Suillus spraguei]KAG2353679.1 hypothetical protein BDR07DRAFT_1465488 [Suillus spraguei]